MDITELIKHFDLTLTSSSILFAIAGALGAFIRDIIDNQGVLVLPRKESGRINLGFIYLCMVGAFVGFIVDSSVIKSMLAGFLCMTIAKGLESYFEKQRSKNQTGDNND